MEAPNRGSWKDFSNVINEKFHESTKFRTPKMVRERWNNFLDPALNKNKWTREEDIILLLAHERVGNKWSFISQFVQGRNDNQIKNRYFCLKRKGIIDLN